MRAVGVRDGVVEAREATERLLRVAFGNFDNCNIDKPPIKRKSFFLIQFSTSDSGKGEELSDLIRRRNGQLATVAGNLFVRMNSSPDASGSGESMETTGSVRNLAAGRQTQEIEVCKYIML